MDNLPFISMELPPIPYYITIGLSSFAIGDRHPNRRNLGIFDLLWVIQGTLFIGEEERQWSVSEGQSLLLLPDRYHYSVKPCERETVFYWIHFDFQGKWSQQTGNRTSPPASPVRQAWENSHTIQIPQYAAPADFKQIEKLFSSLLASSGQSRASTYWEEQRSFIELLDLLEDKPISSAFTAPGTKLANQTEHYLRQHFQHQLSNASLAEALHFHPNYIVRCMKEHYQCSPMEYLHRYRMEQAKLLLLKTELPIAQVAEKTGFLNTPYFSNCFKQYAGISPLQFRKMYSQ